MMALWHACNFVAVCDTLRSIPGQLTECRAQSRKASNVRLTSGRAFRMFLALKAAAYQLAMAKDSGKA
jgi:hypothetical protein